MRRILVCGPTSWTNPRPIEVVLSRLLEETRKEEWLVIEGGANGVDLLAEDVAGQLGMHTARVRALWDAYGRSAGPRRNAVMLSLQPERVIAFHFDRDLLEADGSGTGRCIKQAQKLGIPVSLKMVPHAVADKGVASYHDMVAQRAAKKRRKK